MILSGNLETGRMDEILKDNPAHLVGWCAYNSTRVFATQWQQTTVMNDEAIWWKCPACQSWHLHLMRRDESLEKSQNVVI
jgi:hypothetical protein